MLTLTLVLLFALVATDAKSLKIQDSVQVQVYYETLCPDSMAFITNQLYPTFAVLGSETIQLELIPYGFASEIEVNGTKSFTCQHGPNECYGNKVHACAINLYTVEQSTEFVFCSERSVAPAEKSILKECADIVGISWSDIQECVTNGDGDQLLSKYGQKTDAVKPTFIPTIVLDGEFDEEVQNQSLTSLKKLICHLIGDTSVRCKC